MPPDTIGDRVVVQPLAEAPRVDGRRGVVDYYDLVAAGDTGGRLTAQYVTTHAPHREATGWHYHDVEAQLIVVLEGWVELAFEDGSVRRIEAGTFGLIPGGMRHDQVGKSASTRAVEIVLGTMATVPCDPPSGDAGG